MTVRARYLDPKKGARTETNARELSLGGMFVETNAPLDVGALLTIDVEAAGEKVTLDARVISVRAKPEGEKPAGMGVRFLDLPPDVAASLMKVVAAGAPRDKTILGVGGPAKHSTKPGVAPPQPLPPAGQTEKTTMGIGVPPEALDKAHPKPPLPTRATAPSNPFDAGWEEAAKTATEEKAFDKTMDISGSDLTPVGEPTPAPVKPPPKKGWSEEGAAKLDAEPSTPEGWKWEEGQKPADAEEEPPASAKPAPKKEPPPKKKGRKDERESSIPPPPKGGGGGWLFWLVLLGGAGGAGYYYRDELMKVVNPPAAPTTPAPTASPAQPAPILDSGITDAESTGDAAAKDGGAKDAAAADAASKDAGAADASAKDAGPKDAGKADAAHKKP